MTPRDLVVKAMVVSNDGHVLVLRRSPDDEDAPGRLDFPGGGVEPGESYAESIAREIEEEAGIEVSIDELKLVYAFTRIGESTRKPLTRLLYMVNVESPTVHLSHEHDAYWWRTQDELLALFADISWGEAVRFLSTQNLI